MQFTLRPWHINDLSSLVQYANNAHIARFMTDSFPHPYTEESGAKFLAFATTEGAGRMFAIDIEGRASGGIGLHPQQDIQRKNAELGYWLAEPFWGKGIITEAVKQIVTIGFANMDIDRIFGRVFRTNPASQKVLEKAGLKLEAQFEKTLFKQGEYIDELIYAVRR